MTEILLLGTFHFMESSIDFYSSEVQNELELLADKLLLFNPDVIAVEAAVNAQIYVDKSYEKFSLEDLHNRDKMQNETLGEICMFGKTYPITYNNESIQIGYRLGKMSGHDKVYAIDDDTILNTDVMNSPTSFLTDAVNALNTDMSNHAKGTAADLYKYYNSAEWSKLNHNIYIQANAVNTGSNYAGAEMVAKWYERNLKIFSNIQRLAAKSERLFIIYGAGHLQILRDLINADNNLKLADVYQYL